MTRRQWWAGHTRRDTEDGQISILVLGMTIIAALLILTTAAITSVSIARMRLMDAADSVALAAANAFDESTYETMGITTAVPVSDESVNRAAADHLSRLERPKGFLGWTVAPGTGSPDGQTAVVHVRATIAIPFASAIARNATMNLDVESRARAAVN